jgi:predicted transcriptional regulator
MEKNLKTMVTLQYLLDEARMNTAELARRAGIDFKTCRKAVTSGGPIQRVKVLDILKVLNEELGTNYTIADMSGLDIRS